MQEDAFDWLDREFKNTPRHKSDSQK